jgi:predicted secreted protein
VATRLDVLRHALSDERSGRVVFVSHCLLNQNVRYLGGATRPGAMDEIVTALCRTGAGIVQMPCPEQYARGGVCKLYTLPAYGADGIWLRRIRRPSTRLFLAHTRQAYRRLACRVATQIGDYLRSGYTVESVVGIGGSPSCGVHTKLDLPAVLDDIAVRDPATLNRRDFNDQVIAVHARAGQGLFTAALRRHLGRRHVDVPFAERNLIAEITAEGRAVDR